MTAGPAILNTGLIARHARWSSDSTSTRATDVAMGGTGDCGVYGFLFGSYVDLIVPIRRATSINVG